MFFFLLFLFFLIPKTTFAAGEFNISQNISYTVDRQGTAQVVQEISLKNNYSQIYAKEYQITLVGAVLKNITGTDAFGNIINNIQTDGDQTSINLHFSQPSIGKDQNHQFTLRYSITNFAKKKGNTWEIQFPSLGSSQDSPQTNVLLEVPSSFGDLSFYSAPISSTHVLTDTTQINFIQNQSSSGKVLLIFGNHQLFDFELHYYLKNDQSQPVNTEIPLPPDTNSQTVIFKSITPSPTAITVDADGNWLAQYTISQNESLDITVSGQAKIHPPISRSENQPQPGEYLSSQKYWPVNDSQISIINSSLSSPKSIYQYVVNTLNYDYNQINSASRKGALSALTLPNNSLCTEFTDLFVTLARSKNIPAREIEGYAYSNNSKIKPTNPNSDILHAWPEFYDSVKKQWVQVDPTWEKTTNGIDYFSDLDLNHFTFVIHGLQSDYPSPPGSYKRSASEKSVYVNFATEELKPTFVSPQVTVKNNSVILTNPNLFSLHSLTLSDKDFPFSETIPLIPPLGSVTFNLSSPSFFKSLLPRYEEYKFSLTLAESVNPLSYQFPNQEHYLNLTITIGAVIFLLCIGGIILTVSHKKQ